MLCGPQVRDASELYVIPLRVRETRGVSCLYNTVQRKTLVIRRNAKPSYALTRGRQNFAQADSGFQVSVQAFPVRALRSPRCYTVTAGSLTDINIRCVARDTQSSYVTSILVRHIVPGIAYTSTQTPACVDTVTPEYGIMTKRGS